LPAIKRKSSNNKTENLQKKVFAIKKKIQGAGKIQTDTFFSLFF